MFSGKINSAIHYLSADSSGGVLDMGDVINEDTGSTARDELLKKHPQLVDPPESALLSGVADRVNPIIFQKITLELIKRIARQMQGSSGPSGLDADAWCRMLTTYRKSSDRLCASLAAFARCLCTEELDAADLSAYTAARLIPLDKCPGVRPIAVGETFRRIVGRAAMRIIESDVLSATAPYQLCISVPSACEAGAHAMRQLFDHDNAQGILLILLMQATHLIR